MVAAATTWLLAMTAVVFVAWVVISVALIRGNVKWIRTRVGRIRGWLGEARVRHFHLRKLDRATYRVFNDVYLPRPGSDETTEIDHIVVSRHGIFVIETKNVRGTISGTEHGKEWRITYRSGWQRTIQNPLRQNHLHVLAVQRFLNVGATAVRSLVFFTGNCELLNKHEMGPNVLYRTGLVERIAGYQSDVFTADAEQRCIALLREHVDASDRRALRVAHRAQLRQRHARPHH